MHYISYSKTRLFAAKLPKTFSKAGLAAWQAAATLCKTSCSEGKVWGTTEDSYAVSVFKDTWDVPRYY